MKSYPGLKTATATRDLQLWVHCPYCDKYQDVLDYSLDNKDYNDQCQIDEAARDSDCWDKEDAHEVLVRCKQCEKEFIINTIEA